MTQSGNGGINNYISCENNFEKNSNSKSVKLYGKQSINKPFISIVIPTYKRPCLLKFTIDSAINQTYK